jgi:predicted metal-dependent peptidase
MNCQESYEKMVKARYKMLSTEKLAFFGQLAMNLKLVELPVDHKIKTAATDGRHLYYSPNFIKEISKVSNAQVEFLVAHEVLHAAWTHIARINGRRPVTWNWACDYWINGILVEADFKIIENGLHDVKYKGMSSEEIYEIIKDKMDKLAKGSQQPIDYHFSPDEMDSSGHPIDEALSEKWKQRLSDAYFTHKEMLKNAGQGKGSLFKALDELFEPKIKWYDKIKTTVAENIKSDYTWQRPNRRTFSSGIILPSIGKQEKIRIVLAVDVSGSCFNDIEAFFSEIKGIMCSYAEYEIYIACFDGEVHNPYIIKSENDFNEYLKMIEGGGGTDFLCWWKWFYDNDIDKKVSTVIFFTDGFPCGAWIPQYYDFKGDLFWVIKGGPDTNPPVGTKLNYDD